MLTKNLVNNRIGIHKLEKYTLETEKCLKLPQVGLAKSKDTLSVSQVDQNYRDVDVITKIQFFKNSNYIGRIQLGQNYMYIEKLPTIRLLQIPNKYRKVFSGLIFT